jgi:hypothetical protein
LEAEQRCFAMYAINRSCGPHKFLPSCRVHRLPAGVAAWQHALQTCNKVWIRLS